MSKVKTFEERWASFLERRAQRLRVTMEEAAKPLPSGYVRALQEKAERLGVSTGQLTRQQDTRQKPYPTPDCLTPSDLTDFLNGEELPSDAMQHLTTCVPCFALLDMAAPPEEGLKLLLEEVRIRVSERAVQAEGDLSQMFEADVTR